MSGSQLRTYLDATAVPSKDVVTVSTLDTLAEDNLRIDMTDKNTRSKIETYSFPTNHCFADMFSHSWQRITKTIAVQHVILAICPESLSSRLDSDLDLSHYDLRKDFKTFMENAIKLSETFQLVNNGPPSRPKKKERFRRGGNRHKKDYDKDSFNKSGKGNDMNEKCLPVCLYPPHKAKGIRHFIRDCKACPDNEKNALLKTLHGENLPLVHLVTPGHNPKRRKIQLSKQRNGQLVQ